MRHLTIQAVLLGLATLSVAACVHPHPDPSRFYTLSALPGAEQTLSPASTTRARLSIAAGPVHLPAYLDQDQIVTRLSPNRFTLSENDRWAEPLDHNIESVLVENLSILFGNDDVTVRHWSGRRASYQLEIDVTQFESDTSGTAHLAARYLLRDGRSGETILTKEERLTASAANRSTEQAVASLSKVLGEFSARLAGDIRAQLPTTVPTANDTHTHSESRLP